MLAGVAQSDVPITARDTDDWLTVRQSSSYWKCCDVTIRRYIKAGRLPAALVGRTYRIKRKNLDRLLEEPSVRRELSDEARAHVSERCRHAIQERWRKYRESKAHART
jgi:excisionase family DNA binding protein